MIPTGQKVGCVDIPQDWKPFARARTHLARILSHRRDILTTHKSIITQVKLSKPPTEGVFLTLIFLDKFHQGIVDRSRTSYNMFVDDSLFVAVTLLSNTQ